MSHLVTLKDERSNFALVRALKVAPSALLPEEGDPTSRSPVVLSLLANMRGVEELVETYSRIRSPRLRRALLQLARSLAAGAVAPED